DHRHRLLGHTWRADPEHGVGGELALLVGPLEERSQPAMLGCGGGGSAALQDRGQEALDVTALDCAEVAGQVVLSEEAVEVGYGAGVDDQRGRAVVAGLAVIAERLGESVDSARGGLRSEWEGLAHASSSSETSSQSSVDARKWRISCSGSGYS